jgi:hypothetical protein
LTGIGENIGKKKLVVSISRRKDDSWLTSG